MKTQAEAIQAGYDVDPTGPGRPMGARGRVPNLEMVPLLTDLEAELLNTLGLIRELLRDDAQHQGLVRTIDQLCNVARK